MSTPTIRGGDYRSTRAPDGTWSIRGVPIFADCKRTVTTPTGIKIEATFDRAWQEKAVATAKAKHAATGVMRAIYKGHKTDAGQRPPLGFFLPTDVRDETIDGRKVSVTYADYAGVPHESYLELKSRRFPYKSVEANVGQANAEFTGLAWLSEPPYHDFLPIQTVREESESERASGVIGFAQDATTFAALVRFAMPDIAEEKPDEKPPTPGAPPVAGDPTKAAPPVPDESVLKPDPTGEIGAKVDALTSMMTVLMGLMAKLSGGTQGDMGGGNKPPAVAANAVFGGSTVADTITFNTESFAALQGENAALKAKVDASAKAESKRAALSDAAAKLKGFAGITESELVAQFDAGGATGLNAFVAGAVKFGAADPSNAPLGGADLKNAADPVVASFAGHEDAAMKFGADFDALPESLRGGMSREAWITTSLGYVGVKPAKNGK